jgi:hypothetical protein
MPFCDKAIMLYWLNFRTDVSVYSLKVQYNKYCRGRVQDNGNHGDYHEVCYLFTRGNSIGSGYALCT